jgi:two-component system, OmpR family, sensor histidine kinase KdpD
MGGTIKAGNRRDQTGAVITLTFPAIADMPGMEEEAAQ